MSAVLVPQAFERTETGESELLDCLRKIGKGLISAGTSVGVVENTLTETAMLYGSECDIVALPHLILIDLGKSNRLRAAPGLWSTKANLDRFSLSLLLGTRVME